MVPAQNFGSNHPRNITLACKRCNSFKKHRLIIPRRFYRNELEMFVHQVSNELLPLPSGTHVLIPKYFLMFNPGKGRPIPNPTTAKRSLIGTASQCSQSLPFCASSSPVAGEERGLIHTAANIASGFQVLSAPNGYPFHTRRHQ
jgi:hypothetical protein